MSHKLVSLYIGDGEYYTRIDADKVIAEKNETIDELKERNAELQKATDSAWSKVNAMYDELLRHKYKRCLDKAELCELRYYRTKDLHRTKAIEDKYYMGSPLFKKRLFKLWLYEKWTNKYLKLAEQFKEAK